MMQRNRGRSAFCLLLCLSLLLGGCTVVQAENEVVERINSAWRTLYLADGRVLFAVMKGEAGQQVVDEVICTDGVGMKLWSCLVPPGGLDVRARLVQRMDGGFALLNREGDSPYTVTWIDSDGKRDLFLSLDLEETPYLTSEGCYISAPTKTAASLSCA